jgi:ATP-binding cassette subfamily F protein 3
MSILFHRPELKAIEKEVEVVLKFPEAEALSPPILQVNEVSFYYSPDKMIFNNVNLGATLESRICIVSFFFFNFKSSSVCSHCSLLY